MMCTCLLAFGGTNELACILEPTQEDIDWFDVSASESLKLSKPLFGLCDSRDYWYQTITRHIKEKLGMIVCISNPLFYFKRDDGKLIRLNGN